ncbi:sensor histidine kinase [Spirosoma fluviale]|uniref:histidine kinase n=1 Tax=Spirosoma fluviale TaxID=1597977 RepID=A0A286FZB8_9BACT|nr:7TM diverse intracellular signaling domain-containing protein [Spirosoma fluviale]SOD88611.1 7TMR-DISM extracellular 2 [Spirosoma fluviale]
MKLLLLVLLLSLLNLVAIAQPVVLNDPAKVYHIFQNCEVLALEPGRTTIDSLLVHPEKYLFASVNQKPVVSLSNQVYWFRVELTNQTQTDLLLHFIYFTFQRVTVYEVTGKQVLASQDFTYGLSRGNDNYYQTRRIFPLKVANGQTHTLYFYVEGMYQHSLHVTAQSGMILQSHLFAKDLTAGLFIGFILMIILYSVLLYIRLGDRDNLFYVLWVFITGFLYLASYNQIAPVSTSLHNFYSWNGNFIQYASSMAHLLFALSFLPVRQQAKGLFRLSLLVAAFYMVAILLFLTNKAPDILYNLPYLIDGIICLLLGVTMYRKGFKPALYFIIGNIVFFVFFYISLFTLLGLDPPAFWRYNGSYLGVCGEILFFTLGLTYKVNLLKKHQDEAIQEQLRLTKENQQLVENQKQALEEKVEQRTAELRASQAQLIQKEKLASLGELTAGIAHEIQNPLNFVNNFSEVSAELVEEQKEALTKGDLEEAGFIADDLAQNLQKIHHHGSRASAIVKGMLEHSRSSTGEKAPTELNALANEYLRLAYQGLRAKDKSFNCELMTDFTSDLSKVEVVPQEIGRVLLNLYNNAFYAVHEKQKTAPADYQPTVTVSTRFVSASSPERATSITNPNGLGGVVEIRVRDNGAGIPESIKAKIFQPFFTTKPTGEGTGLGLSLSYDIITKGHGGIMAVESREGQGAEFIIELPSSQL